MHPIFRGNRINNGNGNYIDVIINLLIRFAIDGRFRWCEVEPVRQAQSAKAHTVRTVRYEHLQPLPSRRRRIAGCSNRASTPFHVQRFWCAGIRSIARSLRLGLMFVYHPSAAARIHWHCGEWLRVEPSGIVSIYHIGTS